MSTAPAVVPSHTLTAIEPTEIFPAAVPSETNLPADSTQTPPAATPSKRSPHISISRVQVTQGTGVYVLGETDLPDGECIQTELLAENQPETWWPQDVCIQVESKQWEILVSLGRRGAPENLPDEVQYRLHAWWPKAAQETSIYFPFDLSKPPGAN